MFFAQMYYPGLMTLLIALIKFISKTKWLFMELSQCDDYCYYHICKTLFVRPISFFQYLL